MLTLSRRFVLHKCNSQKKGKHKDEDRISELPDEIIVDILSRLTVKQSVTTSILSRRWRYLWTFSTCLNFDSGKLLRDSSYNRREFIKGIRAYRANFVDWVQHVLDVHQGANVDQFRVFFDLESSHSSIVDSWVKFAIEKQVQRLEMNFCDIYQGNAISKAYIFPNMEKLNLSPNYTLIHLKSLCLIGVDVSEQVIHRFLKECPLLEELRIIQLKTTSNLKIIGSEPLKLKYLDLYRCKPMENLEICAPNLVSFSYTGPTKKVPFRNIPLLSELCIGDSYCAYFISEAPKHLTYLSQLIKLTLELQNEYEIIEILATRANIPKCNNLKQLEVRVATTRGYSLGCLPYFIDIAPKLSKFVIQLTFMGPFSTREYERYSYEDEEHHHGRLEEIELVGFIGHPTDFKLAVELIRYSSALKKVTIDTRHPRMLWGPDVHRSAFA